MVTQPKDYKPTSQQYTRLPETPQSNPAVVADVSNIPRVDFTGMKESAQQLNIASKMFEQQAAVQQAKAAQIERINFGNASHSFLAEAANQADGDANKFNELVQGYKDNKGLTGLDAAEFDHYSLGYAQQVQTKFEQKTASQKNLDGDLAVDDFSRQVPKQAASLVNVNHKLLDFNSATDYVMGKYEGGYNPHDGKSGAPVNYGINQGANPDIDVSKLTPEKAKEIYKTRYWDAIGADKLPEGMRFAAYDTAINMGVDTAKKFIKEANGDTAKFLELRNQKRAELAKDPANARYLDAWAARDKDVQSQSDVSTVGLNAGSMTVVNRYNDLKEQILSNDGYSASEKFQKLSLLKDTVIKGGIHEAFMQTQDKEGFLAAFDKGGIELPIPQADGSIKKQSTDELMDENDRYAMRNMMITEIRRQKEEQQAQQEATMMQNLGTTLSSGFVSFDGSDKQKTAIDKAFTADTAGKDLDYTVGKAQIVASKTGYLPRPFIGQIESGLNSENPSAFTTSFSAARKLYELNPDLLESNFTSVTGHARFLEAIKQTQNGMALQDVPKYLADKSRAARAGLPVDVDKSHFLSNYDTRGLINMITKQSMWDFDSNLIARTFSNVTFNRNTPRIQETGAQAQLFDYILTNADRIKVQQPGIDDDTAIKTAAAQAKKDFGTSYANGYKELFRRPPEQADTRPTDPITGYTSAQADKLLPKDWARNQVVNDVLSKFSTDSFFKARYGDVKADNIIIGHDAQTESEGTYPIYIKSDGTDGLPVYTPVLTGVPGNPQGSVLQRYKPDKYAALHDQIEAQKKEAIKLQKESDIRNSNRSGPL